MTTQQQQQQQRQLPSTQALTLVELDCIASHFRAQIPLQTVMAFGLRHSKVFSGRQAVVTLMEVIPKAMALSPGQTVSREEATAIGQRLIDDSMSFGPLPVQRRQIRNVQDVAMEVENGIFDQDTVLYRLTKDTLLLQEFSSTYFDRFIAHIKDGEKGVSFKDGKVNLFKKISVGDCVFTLNALMEWLDTHAGATRKESLQILRLMLERKSIEKLSFSSCYRFLTSSSFSQH